MSDGPGGRDAAAAGSPPATALEAAIVFGLTIGPSLASGFADAGATGEAAFTDAHLVGLVLWEAVTALLLVPWLLRRGWSPRAIAGAPEPAHVFSGAWLAVLAMGFAYVVWAIFSLMQPEIAAGLSVEERWTGVPAGTAAIVLASVVNPVFEEFLWLGYGVHRLAPRIGERPAIALSVLLRAAVHLYQGPWAVLGVLPLGLTFTWYYARTRRLWPVVVAHLIMDAMSLASRLPSQ